MAGCWFRCRQHVYLFAGAVSLILLVGSLVVQLTLPGFVEQQVMRNLALVKGAAFYETWRGDGSTTEYTVYIFDIEGSVADYKVRAHEVGPFVFDKTTEAIVEELSRDQTEMLFRMRTSFRLNKLATDMKALTRVTRTVNLPLVGAISHKQNEGDLVRPDGSTTWTHYALDSFAFTANELLPSRTAEDTLFTPLKFEARLFNFELESYFEFAIMASKDGEMTEPTRVYTGIDDRRKTGIVISYGDRKSFDNWTPSGACNNLRGTDGMIFPPPITKDSVLEFFVPVLCTTLRATYDREVTLGGLTLMRFKIFDLTFKAPTQNPETRCYCVQNENKRSGNFCSYDGLFDLSKCYPKHPDIVLTKPHFLGSNAPFVDQVIMNPDAERHDSFIDVDPLLGLSLRAQIQTQVNLLLGSLRGLKQYRDINVELLPFFYTNDTRIASRAAIKRLEDVHAMITFSGVLPLILFVLGCISLVVTVLLFIRFHRRRRKLKMRGRHSSVDSMPVRLGAYTTSDPSLTTLDETSTRPSGAREPVTGSASRETQGDKRKVHAKRTPLRHRSSSAFISTETLPMVPMSVRSPSPPKTPAAVSAKVAKKSPPKVKRKTPPNVKLKDKSK